jgi:hypothetical protein
MRNAPQIFVTFAIHVIRTRRHSFLDPSDCSLFKSFSLINIKKYLESNIVIE